MISLSWTFFFIRIVRSGVHTRSTRHVGHLPRVIMRMENLEWRLTGETEVPGENLPQHHFIYKSHMSSPETEVVRKPATNPSSQVWSAYEWKKRPGNFLRM
jgi:hypothetical protein